MHPKSPKLLDDIVRSCEFIIEYTTDLTLEIYISDRLIRHAIEQNLEIIGEALGRLRAVDPDTASQIKDVHKIIGLRSRLAHGYDEEIDNSLVRGAILGSVPALHAEAMELLPEFDP